jgi:uncharacterized protein YbjT (DUF2867 family)
VLLRDPAAAAWFANLGMEPVIADMADITTLGAAFAGVEQALLLAANSPGQVPMEKGFIDAAAASGVCRIVKYSAISAGGDEDYRFARWHGETERHLFASGLDWSVVRPGYFMQNFLMSADSIRAEGRFYLPACEEPVSLVDVRDAAEVTVACLLDRAQGTVIDSGSASATEQLRGTPNLQQGADLIDPLIKQVAANLTAVMAKQCKARTLPPPAALDGAGFTVSCTMLDVNVPNIVMDPASNRYTVAANPLSVSPLGVAVDVDGITVGTTPNAFRATPGLHKLRLRGPGFKPWEATVNITDGFDLRVALQMDADTYARWLTTTKVLQDLKAMNVQYLMGFVTRKKHPGGVSPRGVHPMLEKEAYDMVMKSGMVQRRVEMRR